MCGFIGLLGASVDSETLARAFGVIAWRGSVPGGVSGPGYVLAATRLPRIGDRTNPQPIRGPDGRWLLFNGEAYDLHEAARQAGISDAELLAIRFSQLGAEAAHRLRGEFALAAVEPHRKTVHLARDALGCRPLYYGQRADRVAFGSSARAVAILLGRTDLSAPAVSDYLWYGTSPAGTIFDHVHAVSPGTRITLHAGRPPSEVTLRPPLIVGDVRTALAEAVRSRAGDGRAWVADSGGLDSGLIALTAESPRLRLRLRHDEPDHRASNVIGVDVPPDALRQSAQSLATVSERPLSSLTGAAMLLLARTGRELGRENQLSGEGADELFLGYSHYSLRTDGHPMLRSQDQDRRAVQELLNVAATSRPSRQILKLLQQPDAAEWARFDRRTRLAEHLLLANADTPCLLAGTEGRTPYLDLVTLAPPPWASPGKHTLYAAASAVGWTAPQKVGLDFPCNLLGKDCIVAMAEGAAPSLAVDTCLELEGRDSLAARVATAWTVAESLDGPLQKWMTGILARTIFGVWSLFQTLHFHGGISPPLDRYTNAGQSLSP